MLGDEVVVEGAVLEGAEVALGGVAGFGEFGGDGGEFGVAVGVGVVVVVLGLGDGVGDEVVLGAVERASASRTAVSTASALRRGALQWLVP